MDVEITNRFIDAFVNSFQPPFTGSIPDYIYGHGRLPAFYGKFAGSFDIKLCPYLGDVFSAIQDNSTEIIHAVGAAGTGKTLASELAIPFWITQSPGNILKIHQKKDTITDFMGPRLVPLLKSFESIKPMLSERGAVTKDHITIGTDLTIKVCSPTENDLHGFHCKYLTWDEAHLAEPGDLQKGILRTVSNTGLGRKIVISSTPGIKGGELSTSIHKGLIYSWGWQCPKCKNHQALEWNKQWDANTTGSGYGITWDKYKDKSGNYYYGKTGDTARLVCYYCKHTVADNENERYAVFNNGKHICIKATGDPHIKTWLWSAFVNPKISFKSAVIQYLQARTKHKLYKLDDDLVTFYQSVLGVEWDPVRPVSIAKIAIKAVDKNATWKHIIMAVDYQKIDSARYYVIFGFDESGNGQELLHGQVNSWDEIERISEQFNIPKHCIFVDCGYQYYSVLAESVKRGNTTEYTDNGVTYSETIGWTCLRGEKLKTWDWADGVKRYYSDCIPVDAGPGIPAARMHYWSGTPIKFIFESLRDNRGMVKWHFNSTDNDFIQQLYSETYKEDKKLFTKDNDNNHYYDCCCMVIVGAMLLGIPLLHPNVESVITQIESHQ